MMKFSLPLLFAVVAVVILPDNQCSAFAPVALPPSCSAMTTTSSSSSCSTSTSATALSMGLFDMFSNEAKEERERKKRLVIEEQERLQKEIMDRRRNPEKMDEYEYQTQVRRELRMKGDDEEAVKVAAKIYEGADDQSLLNGTKSSSHK